LNTSGLCPGVVDYLDSIGVFDLDTEEELLLEAENATRWHENHPEDEL